MKLKKTVAIATAFAMSASADILDSVMGRMLRPVGRNLAKDMVTDAMEDIRQDLEGSDEP